MRLFSPKKFNGLEEITCVKPTTSDTVLLKCHRGDPYNHLAKHLWEQLYLMADARRWKRLHAMLCDLTNFEILIKRGREADEAVTFWWWYESEGWTYFDDQKPFVPEGTLYKIVFDPSAPSFMIERTYHVFNN